ncbi:hypothetical protein Tco_1495284, partial [Tanacetum coccineum]
IIMSDSEHSTVTYTSVSFPVEDDSDIGGYVIEISTLNLPDGVPELLHKDFRNVCRDSESLEANGILNYVNDHLKCLFLLWHSSFQSDISRADFDSLVIWNPLFITSSNLLCFLRIYDSA